MERSFAAARALVAALDAARCAQRRPITVALARALLGRRIATGTILREEAMDLGIAGKKALVCAASKGLGRGCALALARNGVAVTITARTEDTLEAAADEIAARERRARSTAVAGDITTPEGRAAALAACPAARHPGQQRRRPAARRLSRLGRGGLDAAPATPT